MPADPTRRIPTKASRDVHYGFIFGKWFRTTGEALTRLPDRVHMNTDWGFAASVVPEDCKIPRLRIQRRHLYPLRISLPGNTGAMPRFAAETLRPELAG